MNYLVMVWVYAPYKIDLERHVEAKNQFEAMEQVFAEFKELPKIKGKHLKEYSFKVITL